MGVHKGPFARAKGLVEELFNFKSATSGKAGGLR